MWSQRRSREPPGGMLGTRRAPDGGDILQAHWRQMQRMREQRRKVAEIQRRARVKSDAERPGRTDGRPGRTWQTEPLTNRARASERVHLPRMRQTKQTAKQTTTRGQSERVRLPEIHGPPARVPVSDSRFQELLSSLLGARASYGDLQRFAPSASQSATKNAAQNATKNAIENA